MLMGFFEYASVFCYCDHRQKDGLLYKNAVNYGAENYESLFLSFGKSVLEEKAHSWQKKFNNFDNNDMIGYNITNKKNKISTEVGNILINARESGRRQMIFFKLMSIFFSKLAQALAVYYGITEVAYLPC